MKNPKCVKNNFTHISLCLVNDFSLVVEMFRLRCCSAQHDKLDTVMHKFMLQTGTLRAFVGYCYSLHRQGVVGGGLTKILAKEYETTPWSTNLRRATRPCGECWGCSPQRGVLDAACSRTIRSPTAMWLSFVSTHDRPCRTAYERHRACGRRSPHRRGVVGM